MCFLIWICIEIVISMIYTWMMRNNAKELHSNTVKQRVTIQLPRAFGWIGLADVIFFSSMIILFLMFPNGANPIWISLGFGLFVILGLSLIIASLVWKIYIYKDLDYLVYTTFFCKNYKILYSEITYFKPTKNMVFIKANRKNFYVDRQATNIEILFEMFRKYRVEEFVNHKFK